MRARARLLALVLLLTACASAATPPASAPSTWTPPPRTRAAGCVARDGRPDPACTPGAVDPRVRQDNLRETVCRPGGYTRSVRPPRGVTDEIKRRAIHAYGAYGGTDPRDYELDHLVNLSIGGAPADEANLWPEARSRISPRGAEAKDAVENYLHDQVCRGRMALAEAQRAIATNWIAVYDTLPERQQREVGEDAGEGVSPTATAP